jgi:predicted HAD superfamily Cof-like phosphohydrolase
MSYFNDVKKFHDKFNLSYDGPPRVLSAEEQGFRWRFLNEELAEVKEALLEEDVAQVAGELADVIWIACGMAHRMGINLDSHWSAIRDANMAKVKASAENPGKRGNAMDIVKPPGWQRPNHDEILERTRQTYEADEYQTRMAIAKVFADD